MSHRSDFSARGWNLFARPNTAQRGAIYKLLVSGAILFFVVSVALFYRSHRMIENHLQGNEYALPSAIYSHIPTLQTGIPLNQQWLIRYLQRLDYQRTQTMPAASQYTVNGNSITFRKSSLLEKNQDFPVQVYFRKGGIDRILNARTKEELTTYDLEAIPISSLFGSNWEKRLFVRQKELPVSLKEAVIAIEDRRFYQHFGIDPFAVVRAIWNNLIRREKLQGASTITQQLAKNFYLTPKRSIRRKISEAFLALVLEWKLSKEQILELYLNEIYLGQRGAVSINGVGAASRLFFRKDVRNITLSEAALLAGMIQAPSAYNPYRNPKEAKSRRDTVLLAMKNTGDINEAEYIKAKKAPIRVYPYKVRVRLAPYFGDLVKQQLLSEYDEDSIYKENLQVITTIDLDMQEAAEEALAWGLNRIDQIRGNKTRKRLQGCLIAIDPKTGYIRAFVGGRNYSRSQFDRISKASRQPGSSFKPFVYATALEMNFEGLRYFNPATLISDDPETFKFHNIVWQPKNYDGQYHGIVPMRTALAKSMNVATAKLAQNVGLQKIADVAKRFGFPNVMPYPSLALGTFEVSPWQLIEAYTVFANGGRRTALQSIEKVIDPSGKLKRDTGVKSEEVLHPQTAYLITDMLRTTMNSGTAASSRRMGFTRPAAGKTGTTNDFRDAWFVGYTPNLMCLVWTGYDDNSPFWMNGAQAALPIWVRFMKRATATLPAADFQSPGGLVSRLIDPTTGKLASEYCFERVTELFIQGSEPSQPCTEYDHYSPYIIGFSTDLMHMEQMLAEPDGEGDDTWFNWPFSDREQDVEEPEVEEILPDEEMSFPEEDAIAPEEGDYIYIAPEPEDAEPIEQDQVLEPQETNPELWEPESEPQSQTQPIEEEPPE